jgi:hypothetical protein
MRAKTEDQKKARSMRKRGYSVKEIAKTLNVSVSSASTWVRETKITREGKRRLEERRDLSKFETGHLRNAEWVKGCAAKRLRWREEGKVAAIKGDPLHVMACSLYWGEGSKSKTDACICNSDVHVLKIFLDFLRIYFEIGEEGVSFKIFSYTDVKSEKEIIEYWVKSLGLDKSKMRKSCFNPGKYESKGKSVKTFAKSAYGTCYLRINCSTRVVQHIYGALEFYVKSPVFSRLY